MEMKSARQAGKGVISALPCRSLDWVRRGGHSFDYKARSLARRPSSRLSKPRETRSRAGSVAAAAAAAPSSCITDGATLYVPFETCIRQETHTSAQPDRDTDRQ